jgi:endonuclease/exonuclease/phosphatase family metal-dependent hydrolase
MVVSDTLSFTILTYNLFLPVPNFLRNHGQPFRAERVIDALSMHLKEHDVDAVCVQELIPTAYDVVVSQALYDLGYQWKTRQIPDALSLHGGIVIYSRHIITQQAQYSFGGQCQAADCFASKGAVYARIKKEGQIVNVICTHLQHVPKLGTSPQRKRQVEIVAEMIEALNLPQEEPLLMAGDLNMDYTAQHSELSAALDQWKMNIPERHVSSAKYTIDPKNNILVGSDLPEEYGCAEEYYRTLQCKNCPAIWVDYTLYSRNHLEPTDSWMKCVRVKASPFRMPIRMGQEVISTDVSDHYPVIGHFEFSRSAMATRKSHDYHLSEDIAGNTIEPDSKRNHTLRVGAAFLLIFGLFVLLVLMVMLARQPAVQKTVRKMQAAVSQCWEACRGACHL